ITRGDYECRSFYNGSEFMILTNLLSCTNWSGSYRFKIDNSFEDVLDSITLGLLRNSNNISTYIHFDNRLESPKEILYCRFLTKIVLQCRIGLSSHSDHWSFKIRLVRQDNSLVTWKQIRELLLIDL